MNYILLIYKGYELEKLVFENLMDLFFLIVNCLLNFSVIDDL